MLTRRKAMLLAGAAWAVPGRLAAADPPSVKLGLLEFGTAAWEAETIQRFGLDRAAGIRIETTRLASNDAARVAFLGGGVDAIVGDLLWAARLRGEGRNLLFLPYSSTEGALMVPAASTIRSVADLHGARLGVSGGALDKTWLLLQAMARQGAGLDLAASVQPAFGAPPLLSQKLESGELDAALLYWNFCARLEARGFRRVVGVPDMLHAFGIDEPISFVGYIVDADRVGARALAGFAAASKAAKTRLAAEDEAWTTVRPLMKAEDEATYRTLKTAFIAGFPHRSLAAEQADAQRLYGVLTRLGGDKLVGGVTQLPPGLYWPDAS